MGTALVWTPSLALGVREIDLQHEGLFARAGAVSSLIAAGSASRSAAGPIADLVDYTALHFDTEHRLMSAHAFPDAEMHDDQHAELLDQLRRFTGRLLTGLQQPDALKAVRFLAAWLTQHIKHSDRELAVYLRGRGVD